MAVQDVSQSQEVDLTGYHLHDLTDVIIPDDIQVLELMTNRLREIDERILSLTGLKRLSLRQNLLTDAGQLSESSFKASLQSLVLHDNQLPQIPLLGGYTALQTLELSYNSILSLQPLSTLQSTSLEELFVANNAIQQIEAVQHLTNLRLLELGSNKIRQINGLEPLQKLQELWLGQNRVTQISGLDQLKSAPQRRLTSLRRLSLQSNRLASMAGFERCMHLEELYLSHNGISKLEGLERVANLRILDVSNNRVTEVEGLESLQCLRDLWLNDNQLPTLDSIEAPARAGALGSSLTCLYINGNPATAQDAGNVKSRMLAAFPKLEQLDDAMV